MPAIMLNPAFVPPAPGATVGAPAAVTAGEEQGAAAIFQDLLAGLLGASADAAGEAQPQASVPGPDAGDDAEADAAEATSAAPAAATPAADTLAAFLAAAQGLPATTEPAPSAPAATSAQAAQPKPAIAAPGAATMAASAAGVVVPNPNPEGETPTAPAAPPATPAIAAAASVTAETPPTPAPQPAQTPPAPAPAANLQAPEPAREAGPARRSNVVQALDTPAARKANEKSAVHAAVVEAAADANATEPSAAAPAGSEAEISTKEPARSADTLAPASAQAGAAPATPHAAASAAVRGSPETVANLAAHILKKLEGRSTRFDVGLEPAGLGRVDVRVEIGLNGRLTAAMSFDNPLALTELRSRASELARSLEQAGFDLSGGLSFDLSGGQQRSTRQDGGEASSAGQAALGRQFQAALEAASSAVDAVPMGPLYLSRRRSLGVDVRI